MWVILYCLHGGKPPFSNHWGSWHDLIDFQLLLHQWKHFTVVRNARIWFVTSLIFVQWNQRERNVQLYILYWCAMSVLCWECLIWSWQSWNPVIFCSLCHITVCLARVCISEEVCWFWHCIFLLCKNFAHCFLWNNSKYCYKQNYSS
jgi:hypothetical protein